MDNETEMPESFSKAFGKYLRTLARHDDDLRVIAKALLDARDCWPSAFDDKTFAEAITRFSTLQCRVKAGLEPRADDWEMTVAEAEFERVMCKNLNGKTVAGDDKDTPKATKR